MAHQTSQPNALLRSITADNAAAVNKGNFEQPKIRNLDNPSIDDLRMNENPFQGQSYPVWNQQQQSIQMENLNIDQQYVPRGQSFQQVAYEHLRSNMAKDLPYSEMPIGHNQMHAQMLAELYTSDQYNDQGPYQALGSNHSYSNFSSSEDGSFEEIVQEDPKNLYEQHLSGKPSEELLNSSPQDSDEDFEPEQKPDISQKSYPRRSDIKTRTSKRVRVADPDYNEESDDDEDEEEDEEDLKPNKKELQKQMQRDNWTPKTTARRYNLKKSEDKEDPQYQLRRAKNNDSVRKSRNKKKEEELAREEMYERIEVENGQLKNRVKELEKKLENCHCQKETTRKQGRR